MRYVRFDIGFEPVFVRQQRVPKGRGLFVGKRDTHYGFNALEAILPGNDQADRDTMLFEQRLAVNAGRDEGEFVLRFVDRQCFGIKSGIGPVQHVGGLLWSIECFKCDEPGRRLRLDRFQQVAQPKPGPRHTHSPCFHAAMTVGPLFQKKPGVDIVQIKRLRFAAKSVDHQAPGAG